MEEQQKVRLAIIGIALVCLVAGGVAYSYWQNSQLEKVENQAQSNLPQQTMTATAKSSPSPDTTIAQADPSLGAQSGEAEEKQPGTSPEPLKSDTREPTVQTKQPAESPAIEEPGAQASIKTPAQAQTDAIARAKAAPKQESPRQIAMAEKQEDEESNSAEAKLSDSRAKKTSSAGKFPATKREHATTTAKNGTGRSDPMVRSGEREPFPPPWTKAAREGAYVDDEDEHGAGRPAKTAKLAPPPPPSERPIPPPPPSAIAEMPQLPIDSLPQPPDKPLVSPKLKLVAILGNKALLKVPPRLRMQNKWPNVIALAPGERFDDPNHGSFSVVAVDQDSVTIEEEMERSVKSLPPIR